MENILVGKLPPDDEEYWLTIDQEGSTQCQKEVNLGELELISGDNFL